MLLSICFKPIHRCQNLEVQLSKLSEKVMKLTNEHKDALATASQKSQELKSCHEELEQKCNRCDPCQKDIVLYM